MTLKVTDEPPDRPEWVSETIRLVSEVNDQRRGELLARVARASDADLTGGSDDAWGLGQIAVHLLLIERGAALIALGLSKGELPGNTGQPRPSAAAVTREGSRASPGRPATPQRACGRNSRPSRTRRPWRGIRTTAT